MSSGWWQRFDWWLFGAMMILLVMGLSMIASSTLGTNQPYFTNQLLFGLVGLIVFVLLARLPASLFGPIGPVVYGLSIGLLAVVAIAGKVTRGAASWLYVGPFALQPSEFAKLGLIFCLALLVRLQEERRWPEWRFFAYSLGILLPPLILTLIQPDLGSALVMVALWLVSVWSVGLDKKLFGSLILVGVLVGLIGWFRLEPYQKQRILTFLDPASSPLGSGYNVLQSIIAVGSGQFWGRGWGRGTQSHLNFLPEHHTDFIFAMLAEEWGFVGALAAILLYGIICWRCLGLIWRSKDRSLIALASGILGMLIFQAAVNMAMTVGLAPVTGIPLPMVSYGGSSLLTTMAAFGILQSVALSG